MVLKWSLFVLVLASSCRSTLQPPTDASPSEDRDAWTDAGQLENARPSLGLLPGTVGFVDNDRNPEVGPLDNWTYARAAALDYQFRSVGVDLGAVRPFNQVR